MNTVVNTIEHLGFKQVSLFFFFKYLPYIQEEAQNELL